MISEYSTEGGIPPIGKSRRALGVLVGDEGQLILTRTLESGDTYSFNISEVEASALAAMLSVLL